MSFLLLFFHCCPLFPDPRTLDFINYSQNQKPTTNQLMELPVLRLLPIKRAAFLFPLCIQIRISVSKSTTSFPSKLIQPLINSLSTLSPFKTSEKGMVFSFPDCLLFYGYYNPLFFSVIHNLDFFLALYRRSSALKISFILYLISIMDAFIFPSLLAFSLMILQKVL